MNILFLCHRIPYPPNKGDKIRSFNEIKYLSKGHQIDLACFADDPNDLQYRKDLEAYCRHIHVEPLNKLLSKIKGLFSLLKGGAISVGYFYSKKLQRVVNQWCIETPYDAVICFSSPMAEYMLNSNTCKQECLSAVSPPSVPASQPPSLLIDFCDLDSDKWRQYAQQSKFPMNLIYKTEFDRLLAYEIKINQTFDHSIFVSQKEADLFKTLYPTARNLSVIPNGVDSTYFIPSASASQLPSLPASQRFCLPASQRFCLPASQRFCLLFTGAMDYQANIDGVSWFCREIFPALRAGNPDLQFLIVGSNPTAQVRALADADGISVTGFVDDVRPYYAMADICVIPLRMARGVQNKVLEAMAMGKPIVTTAAAVQGVSATPGEHLVVSDSALSFAEGIKALFKDNAQREQLGNAAREFVMKHYDWTANMNQLNRLIIAGQIALSAPVTQRTRKTL